MLDTLKLFTVQGFVDNKKGHLSIAIFVPALFIILKNILSLMHSGQLTIGDPQENTAIGGGFLLILQALSSHWDDLRVGGTAPALPTDVPESAQTIAERMNKDAQTLLAQRSAAELGLQNVAEIHKFITGAAAPATP